MIHHHICYIPEIVIEVPKEWMDNFNKTGNPENKDKRIALMSAIKRWIYLSWILHSSDPKNVQEAYNRRWIWDEIAKIKTERIPEILSPHRISFITPYYELPRGRLVQFSKSKKPVILSFPTEQQEEEA